MGNSEPSHPTASDQSHAGLEAMADWLGVPAQAAFNWTMETLYTDKFLESCKCAPCVEIQRVGPHGFVRASDGGVEDHQWRIVETFTLAGQQEKQTRCLATLYISWAFPPSSNMDIGLRDIDVLHEPRLQSTLQNAVLVHRLSANDPDE